MSVTLETSQLEMLPLNDVAPRKIDLISVTPDTFQSPIGPCGPREQSLDNIRQVVTTVLSSALDFGENVGLSAQDIAGMEIRRAKKMT